MENHKIKLTFAIFILSFSLISGLTLEVEAVPFCHAKGSGGYTLLDTSDPGFEKGHKNHQNDLLGDACVVVICGEGFDLIDGVCVEDPPLVCDPGYHEEDGVCVEDPPLVCDPGYHEEDGVCVEDPPLVCDPGYHEEDGVCVEDPPLVCDPGYHEEDGVCVEDPPLVCDPGYHEEDGVCVEDPPLVCDFDCLLQLEENDGGDNAWDTRPTFGVSHENREDVIVDAGFRFNDQSFAVTDNHHTPFDEQTIEIGAVNSFAATVYADKDLQVQEFLFGVPQVGMGYLAEMRVEVWFDYTGEISYIIVKQDTEVIDRSSLSISHQKVKCMEIDTEEKCDRTSMSAVFLEPLLDNVMAIKAIDFKHRDQTTYLNDGFDISGDSLNPMTTEMIPSPLKGEGLIKVTQNEKYSNYWSTDDGRIFEKNSFDSFTQINHEFKRFQDTGDPKSRLHSAFANLIELEAEKAKAIFDSSELSRDCNFRVCE